MSDYGGQLSLADIRKQVTAPSMGDILRDGPGAVTEAAREFARLALAEGHPAKAVHNAVLTFQAEFEPMVQQAHAHKVSDYYNKMRQAQQGGND